jgi:hypothetical protein
LELHYLSKAIDEQHRAQDIGIDQVLKNGLMGLSNLQNGAKHISMVMLFHFMSNWNKTPIRLRFSSYQNVDPAAF